MSASIKCSDAFNVERGFQSATDLPQGQNVPDAKDAPGGYPPICANLTERPGSSEVFAQISETVRNVGDANVSIA